MGNTTRPFGMLYRAEIGVVYWYDMHVVEWNVTQRALQSDPGSSTVHFVSGVKARLYSVL